MENPSDFFDLTAFIKNADAYVFLAGWLWMMYTKRLRWGWDFDDLDQENEKLREVITRYQDKVESRLERLESLPPAKGPDNEGPDNE